MSKRNLVIIIALLVIVDIAAAFWYLSLRIEASGESHDLWQRSDTTATVADTLTTASIPDTFDIKEFHAYHVSRTPSIRGDENSYYVCVRRVKVRWPASINGNDSLPALERALHKCMFGNENNNLAASASQWMSTPHFTIEALTDYKQTQRQPKLVGRYAYCEQLLAYPILTSLRMLVMEVDHRTRNGETSTLTTQYVHYDRIKQSVIQRKSIINPNDEHILLSLINNKIEHLNREKQLQLEHASKVANDFHATRMGIIFDYPAGEIAPTAEGVIEVLIDYPQLGPVLTQDFKNLLNLNDGYWKYKPIDHNL